MSERDEYQAGVPCWVATVQPDPASAVDFYTELFGWETENRMPPDHPGDYFVCKLRGRDVAAIVSQHGAPAPPDAVWTTLVSVESADGTASAVSEAGGSVIGEPFDSPGGGRQAVLADPSGAVFCAWQPQERRGAQLVNEPGAWSMSRLNTRDLDAAKEFYGGVFGWETEGFEMGGAEISLWRLPGYEGGEPKQPVPRDVVGVMTQMSTDQFPDEVPPHWSVDFWIDDADAAAGKAGELGGNVIAPPFDIPGFRTAVLADPQGAAFSVSQLLRG
jgi:predicted enzyme related to lactoylglutathione lyase